MKEKKRHKWSNYKNRKDKYSVCVKCGCIKQKYYGVMFYFNNSDKSPFLKAPNCDNNLILNERENTK